jgi:hypothetical protein
MAFTVKATVASVEKQTDGQSKVVFSANYTDPATGERVNTEWAKYTPGFSCNMWVLDEVVERDGLAAGQAYTLTFTKED